MKRLLVPIDFSPVTDDVIDSALTFASAFKARVTLLNVVQPLVAHTSDYALPVAIMREAADATEEAARSRLAAYERTFRKAGIACETRVLSGRPVPLIVREARRTRADFIIMGSHGHGKVYDLLVGSTASGVISKAGCGVILLPPEDKAYE